jgi:hypothetical protein
VLGSIFRFLGARSAARKILYPLAVLFRERREAVAAPIASVEWWIRQNLVRYEVLMQVAVKIANAKEDSFGFSFPPMTPPVLPLRTKTG